MTVTQAYTVDNGIFDVHHKPPMLNTDDSRSRMFLVGNLCNHSHMDRSGKNVGQATEVALVNVLSKVGLSDQRKVCRKTRAPASASRISKPSNFKPLAALYTSV